MNKNTKKHVVPGLLFLMLLLASCSDDNPATTAGTGTGGGGNTGGTDDGDTDTTTSLSLDYLNSRNGNALISIAASSAFPTGPIHVPADQTSVGNFFQAYSGCVGASIPFTFKLTNQGPGSITASASPAVALTDTTAYDYDSSGSSSTDTTNDYTLTLTTPPTFPIAAGASSNFTVTLNKLKARDCTFGELYFVGDAATRNRFQMVIQTNDTTNPNYSVDFSVLGYS